VQFFRCSCWCFSEFHGGEGAEARFHAPSNDKSATSKVAIGNVFISVVDIGLKKNMAIYAV
jgi:hypothetical protein